MNRHRGLLVASALVAVAWELTLPTLAVYHRNCLIQSCALSNWLVLIPIALLPIAVGFVLGPDYPLPRSLKLKASLCSGGACMLTLAIGSLLVASGDSDLLAGGVIFLILFFPASLLIGYILVGATASVTSGNMRKRRESRDSPGSASMRE